MSDTTAMIDEALARMRADADRASERHARRMAKWERMSDELHAAKLASMGAPPSRALQMLPAPEPQPAPPTISEQALVALVQTLEDLRADYYKLTHLKEAKKDQREKSKAVVGRKVIKVRKRDDGGKALEYEVD